MKERTRQESVRVVILFVLIVGFFSLAAARLVHLQILLGPRYARIVDRQSSRQVAIPAERGMIYDRYGRQVASNVVRHALYAYPNNQRELANVIEFLSGFYSLVPTEVVRKFRLAVRKFSYIERRLGDDAADHFALKAPSGLYLRQETRREYPYGLVGKQILGFTNIDNKGLSGFEYSADSILSGNAGIADVRRDGLRNTFRVKEKALVKPKAGTSVVLTVDWRFQEIVEQELRAAVDTYNAESGQAVFLDCRTGDILAVAHFDPKERNPARPTKLRAISDQFEPGSVIKAFTAAGLLDAGLVDFSDSVFCEEGLWKIGRRRLHDDKEFGWLSFRGVMELSSNIGVGKHACRLGGEKLFETFERFGLGSKTLCGLPGESRGSLPRPDIWSDYNISALAMGHSVAATPLQIAAGFAAIANGGELLRPRILLGEVASDGSVINRRHKEVIRRAMLPTSVDSLKSILRGVVTNGTAEEVNSTVVEIAGKTGTAEIPNPLGGGYFKHRFMASFAGYFPGQAPVIAGIVVLARPRPVTYGGLTAGPAFRKMTERYVVANPDIFSDPNRTLFANSRSVAKTAEVPDLAGRDIAFAKEIANRRGLRLRSDAKEGVVAWQFPPADRLVFLNDELLVAVETPDGEPVMSDLRGLSLRRASAFLAHLGVSFTVQGQGLVVKQSVAAGEKVTDKTFCRLECRPFRGRSVSN